MVDRKGFPVAVGDWIKIWEHCTPNVEHEAIICVKRIDVGDGWEWLEGQTLFGTSYTATSPSQIELYLKRAPENAPSP